MTFDIQAAKDAGYSTKEIKQFLEKQRKQSSFDKEKAREAGYSDEEIEEFLTEKKVPSRARSLLSAFPKGALKSAREISQFQDPLPQVLKLLFPGAEDQTEESLEAVLPTQEGQTESILERAGKIAPYLAGGGGTLLQNLLRSLVGSTAGEIGKTFGGDTGETIGEIVGLGLPGLGKKIVGKIAQKGLLDTARKASLSEKEIAPLLQTPKKSSVLGKLASKGEKAQKRLKGAKQGVNKIYDFIRSTPEANKNLPRDLHNELEEGIGKALKKLTPHDRSKLQPLVTEYLEGEFNGKNLIDFYTKLNKYYGKGLKEASLLQKPIEDVLAKSGGTMAKDFKNARKLASNLFDLTSKLKPKKFDDYLQISEYVGLATALGTGNWSAATKVLGEIGARKLMREMLTNPRFQNLAKQSVKAINEGKYRIADQIMKKITDKLKSLPKEKKNSAPEEAKPD